MIAVCFRWMMTPPNQGPYSDAAAVRVLERQPTGIRLAVQVPNIGEGQPARFWGDQIGSYAVPHLLVPQADVRVLLFDNNLNLVFDGLTKTGVTSIAFAALMVLLAVGFAFTALWLVRRRRLPPTSKADPVLCLITTRSGFASFSQFQIILWTFVVIASAVYVIALSGDLIPITVGTLVLLGISGTTGIIAKAKNESDATATLPPPDPAATAAEALRAEEDARQAQIAADLATGDARADAELTVRELLAKAEAAKAKADAAEASTAATRARAALASAAADNRTRAAADARTAQEAADAKQKAAAIAAAKAALVTRVRHPLWSDLVMEEYKGRELDVARVQMLFFTLVTAVFVGLKVVTSYEIPGIPEGFLILMGISNGVYVGSKFASNPAARS